LACFYPEPLGTGSNVLSRTRQETDVAITFERDGTSSRIRLTGVIDVAAAEELKDVFLEALGSSQELDLVVAEVTYLDVTAVQLLWAARREASTQGVAWIFEDAVPEEVLSTLSRAGLAQPALPDSGLTNSGVPQAGLHDPDASVQAPPESCSA
jgi:anti-anti-sigma regulatory factor